MAIGFLVDAGIYLPSAGGVKFTAISSDLPAEFVVSLAALVATGAVACDPAGTLKVFEQTDRSFERGGRSAYSAAPAPIIMIRRRTCRHADLGFGAHGT